jgi:hypothetical protein
MLVYHWVISEISPKSTFFLAQQHQGIMDLVEWRTVVARVPWQSYYQPGGGGHGHVLGSFCTRGIWMDQNLRIGFCGIFCGIPNGKRLHNYGKSPCPMGKSTISMAIFNSYVKLPEGTFLQLIFFRCVGKLGIAIN